MQEVQSKNKYSLILENVSKYFLYLLIIYLPFYELVLHLLESRTRLSTPAIFWFTHFYEPLIVLFVLAYIIKFAIDKKISGVQKGDIYIIIFILYAILLAFIRHNDIQRGLEGLRFLILPFVVYLIARLSNYSNPRRLIKIYLFIAVLFAAIGAFEYFFLPKGYMATYYQLANFGFGENSLVTISQATALLAGPNQLASYLILAFFYLLHRFFISKKSPLSEYENYFLLLVILTIGLTYSRSALIGVAIGTIWMFIYFGKSSRSKIIYSILSIAVALSLVFFYAIMHGELLRDLLTHGSSFSQHLSATHSSFNQFIHAGVVKILTGLGIGSAGPTALKLGGVITENYYLQILFETGIIGFILFLLFLIKIIGKLYKSSKTLFFAFVALLINALFLHIFSDNPVMAVTVFIIIAVVINIEERNSNVQVPMINQSLNSKS